MKTIFKSIYFHFTLAVGKLAYKCIRILGRQASSKPGALMLKLNPSILEDLARKQDLILVSGTNGKTSTTQFLTHLLKKQGLRVASNASGANLRSGLVTSLALNVGKVDVMVLEVDEAVLIKEVKKLPAKILLLSNLFRDQLDRYGELHYLYQSFQEVCQKGQFEHILLNADDPLLAALPFSSFFSENENSENSSKNTSKDMKEKQEKSTASNLAHKYRYYGMEATGSPTCHESMLCPFCHQILVYEKQTLSHLGKFSCPCCQYRRPLTNYRVEMLKLDKGRQLLRMTKGNFIYTLSDEEMEKVYFTKKEEMKEEQRLCPYENSASAFPQDIFVAYHEGMRKKIQQRASNIVSTAVAFPLLGLYNAYNALSAVAASDMYFETKGIQAHFLDQVKHLSSVQASFGRLERQKYQNKELCFFLIKNPAGFNQALSFLMEAEDVGACVFGLNDQAPDGRDVSWIWDAQLECFQDSTYPLHLLDEKKISFIGQRSFDMALRFSYAYPDKNFSSIEEEGEGTENILQLLEVMEEGKCLYLFLNYTCLLQQREALAKKLGFSHIWE